MSMDEHIIECVLGILVNKRVSDKIYEIVNKSPASSKPLITMPKVTRVSCTSEKGNSIGERSNVRNLISKYKDDIIKLQQSCSEQEKKISEIEAEKKTLSEKNSQLESQLIDYQRLCVEKEQMEKDYAHLQEECDKKQQELVQQQNKYSNFDVPLAMLNLYNSLPEELKTRNLIFKTLTKGWS